MNIIEILLIGVGLSMDAFAVSIVKGMQMNKVMISRLLAYAIAFGAFQGLMPCLGWLLGSVFAEKVSMVDHWIAFILLGLIGGNMIKEAIEEQDEEIIKEERFSISELFLLAVATSIDALAIGVTFSFLSVNIITSAIIIAATTFTISAAGVLLGHFTGGFLRDKAQVAGGLILIALGIRILITHLVG